MTNNLAILQLVISFCDCSKHVRVFSIETFYWKVVDFSVVGPRILELETSQNVLIERLSDLV